MLPNYAMQENWCGIEEMQAKVLKRQETAAKQERAMAYAPGNFNR